MNIQLMKLPSGWIPRAMSLVALAMAPIHATMYGVVLGADEGTAAHIFQLLMTAQVSVAAFFAIRWLPQVPRQTLQVLALQAGAALAAIAAVFFLN